MATGRVTKHSVDMLPPTGKDYFFWDEEFHGFGVQVTPTGAQVLHSSVSHGRPGGPLEAVHNWPPWLAMDAADRAQRGRAAGHHGPPGRGPGAGRYERRRQAIDLAFDSYVESFVDLYLKKRWKQWPLGAGVLRREAVPVLRRKPLPQIRRSDLSAIADRLHDRPAIARLTHATLRKLFRWAVSRGDLDRSPLEGVEPPPPVPARDRVLSDEEVALVWQGSEELGWPFAGLFRLLLLTGQRRDEVASLSWGELDQARLCGRCPPTDRRTKSRIWCL